MRFVPISHHARTMRRLATALALAAGLGLAAPAAAAPEKYAVDEDHFSVAFLVDHAGFAKIAGMFLAGGGSFTFDPDAKTVSDVRIVIETDSVFTNHKKRDDHLRSPDFLNSDEFPEMVFVGSKAQPTGDHTGKITGTLSLLGVEKPVTLDLTWNKSGKHPFGGHYATGISARGSFKRSDFGMTYQVKEGGVGDVVELIIEMEAKRQ